MIGGGRNPLIVKTLAKYADEWNAFNCPKATFQELRGELDQNKPADKSIEVSQMLSFIVARTSGELERKLERLSSLLDLRLAPKSLAKWFVSGGRLCGTAEEIIAQLNERREAGVQRFYFQILDPSDKDMVDLLTNILKAKI